MTEFFKKYGMLALALGLAALAGCNGGGCNNLGPNTMSAGTPMIQANWETGDTTVWTQLNANSSLTTTSSPALDTQAGLFGFAASSSPSVAYATTTQTPSVKINESFAFYPIATTVSAVTEFHLIQNGIDRAGLRWDSLGGGFFQASSGGSWVNLTGHPVHNNMWNYVEVLYTINSNRYSVWVGNNLVGQNLLAGSTLNARSGWEFDVLAPNSPGHQVVMDDILIYY
jgi:hypothetical protein